MSYVSYIHKPSSVRNAVVCQFVDSTSCNVIIAKSNCIEIYEYNDEKNLQLLTYTNIFGRIVGLNSFRPALSSTDHIIVATDSFHYFTLFWDSENQSIANGIKIQDCSVRSLRESQSGPILLVDPFQRVLCLHVYQGLLTIIPIVNSKKRRLNSMDSFLHDNFNVRIKELDVIDICMLHTPSVPTLAVLYRDSKSVVHLSTYTINIRECEIDEDDLVCHDIEEGKLIAHNNGGVFIFGEMYVYYISKELKASKSLLTYPISAFTGILVSDPLEDLFSVKYDPNHFFVTDESGFIYHFYSEFSHNGLKMDLEKLGESSIASCLVSLPQNKVFLGSHYGDSAVLQLDNPGLANQELTVQTLQIFPNIAPISDFTVEHESSGSSILTCSGAYKDGSIRVLKNTVSIQDIGIIDMESIKEVFSVSFKADYDNYIIISFPSETRVLYVSPEGEFSICTDLSCDSSTLSVGVVDEGKQLLQITTSNVRLFNGSKLISWSPQANITNGTIYEDLVCVALTGGTIIFLRMLEEIARYQCDSEISCLGFLDDSICFIGLWSCSVLGLKISQGSIQETCQYSLKDVPRSLTCFSFSNQVNDFLYVTTNDGQFLQYSFGEHGIYNIQPKVIRLGNTPVSIKPLIFKDKSTLVSIAETQQFIHMESKRLVFTPFPSKEIVSITRFCHPTLNTDLVYCTGSKLVMASLGAIQGLTIQTIPVEGFPRRICSSEKHYFVLCMQLEDALGSQEQSLKSSLRVFDKLTLEEVCQFEFDANEMVESIVYLETNSSIIVGTGYNYPDQDTPDSGRLLMFTVNKNNLNLISTYKVQGSVNTLESYKGLIVAGINATVSTFAFREGSFHVEGCLRTPTYTIDLCIDDDDIVIGDLMKSISVINFSENQLTELARDFKPIWVSSVDKLDKHKYFVCDADGNAFVFLRDVHSPQIADRKRLRCLDQYYLGEFVNKTRTATLTKLQAGSFVQPRLISVTVDGAIMLIGDANDNADILLQLQDNVRRVLPSTGGLSHEDWRRCHSEVAEELPSKLIDGNLLEGIVDMPLSIQDDIVQGKNGGLPLNISVNELVNLSESLARLHS
ncbi:damaged DNA binding protein Ddb1 [Schizosaccharomyces cryophilus OY26]|uniref:Damaged DNA binding protein Ddb1 n=1 Tax=Schizosaccharomyces cryophilus (strain OY26 / ATCC MYA-4695 / CBS 11777 / NBRC 106824 / NRRL Y48691) TaxID=653667 RepID=S9XCX8_SCHCR|nr:damaged DNA binding protein Ddb1 [Schizosaccharomyces cryophilus OY26]EPY51696.1 damaged DNA binding protein Ddb1 [Schizosaccharomyces cryophilus OY26]